MIDTVTRKPLQVANGGTAGPYLIVPMSQLDQVRAVLDANGLHYWVDDFAISMDGEPEEIFMNFVHDTDRAAVQRLLDSLP